MLHSKEEIRESLKKLNAEDQKKLAIYMKKLQNKKEGKKPDNKARNTNSAK